VKSPELDRVAVLRLAELAHLRVEDASLDTLTRDLAQIVKYAAELQEVDVEGVAPMERPGTVGRSAARPDEPGLELDRSSVLAEAPRAEDDGFAVPSFMDEG